MNSNRFTQGVGLVTKVALVGSSVALLGAACWKGVGTNTNVGSGNVVANENTNTVAGNRNVEVNTNVNVNTNSTGEIDTSDWLSYSSDSLSFIYPKIDGDVEYFEYSCDDQNCVQGSRLGWRQVDLDGTAAVIAGTASADALFERDYLPTDYAFFDKIGNKYYLNGIKEIQVEKTGTINGQDYIIYNVTSLSPAIDQNLPGKVAMIALSEGNTFGYRAFTFYFTKSQSDKEIISVLSSLKFE